MKCWHYIAEWLCSVVLCAGWDSIIPSREVVLLPTVTLLTTRRAWTSPIMGVQVRVVWNESDGASGATASIRHCADLLDIYVIFWLFQGLLTLARTMVKEMTKLGISWYS